MGMIRGTTGSGPSPPHAHNFRSRDWLLHCLYILSSLTYIIITSIIYTSIRQLFSTLKNQFSSELFSLYTYIYISCINYFLKCVIHMYVGAKIIIISCDFNIRENCLLERLQVMMPLDWCLLGTLYECLALKRVPLCIVRTYIRWKKKMPARTRPLILDAEERASTATPLQE